MPNSPRPLPMKSSRHLSVRLGDLLVFVPNAEGKVGRPCFVANERYRVHLHGLQGKSIWNANCVGNCVCVESNKWDMDSCSPSKGK